MELCYEMAIAAVIVLHGRAEKSNFIDIQGEKKEKKRRKIPPAKKMRHEEKKKNRKGRAIERETEVVCGGREGWKETW